MRYVTESGLVIEDRRHTRTFDDPRGWPPNPNFDPPPPDRPGVGPNMSEGFGNENVMYPDWLEKPPVQAWSGWPVEWNMPNWGSSVEGGLQGIVNRVSTVFGAIDLNSSILSTMPPYRLQGGAVVGSLPWMQNPQPEVYTGWTEAMKQVVMSYYNGEAFLWATSRYTDGTVRNWVMLNPAWVDIEMEGQMRTYEMGGLDITPDVLHLRYASWPGTPHGIGPLEALTAQLFGVAAMERYQSNLATRGGIPWGVLTAPGNLSRDQSIELRDKFVAARMSAMGAPAVMSGGVTLAPFTITPKDMALLELRQFDEARISVLLGVPPMLLALPEGQSSMTYKNAEGVYDFHWRAYLRPKAATIAEAISQWALPRGQTVEFNRDEYVQGNPTERTAMYANLYNIYDPVTGQRAITIDEIREAERMSAIDATMSTPTTGDEPVTGGIEDTGPAAPVTVTPPRPTQQA
jgi:HK97 family phage portal protein